MTDQFSDHLFWDVDRNKLDFERNKKWLVGRVLEYGLMSDWLLLKNEMSIQQIAAIAKDIRQLDDISLNFIATLSGIPKEEFAAFNKPQNAGDNWHF